MLHDFHQRLHALALRGIIRIQGAAIGALQGKHLPRTQVRVVWNDQRFTAAVAVVAIVLKRIPKQGFARGIDVARGEFGNLCVAKHHVAVQIAPGCGGHTGPLITDKGGECAGAAAVIVRFRRIPHVLPGRQRRRVAALAIVSTEAEVRGPHRCHVVEQVEGTARPCAVEPTLPAVVSRHLRVVAHFDFANQFGVI